MNLPQHAMNAFPLFMLGNNRKQIGQSSALGGCLIDAIDFGAHG
jgi:hypothetical protein